MIGESNINSYNTKPASWYPVGISSKLKVGQARLIQLFDDDWTLFRNQQGELGCVARYCLHMGADLSCGGVKGENIICPLHRWAYDKHGRCKKNSSVERDTDLKLKTLQVADFSGIIFVFSTSKVDFNFSDLGLTEGQMISSVTRLLVPINYLSPALNAFDIEHYRLIHNREIIDLSEVYSHHPAHLGIHFKAKVIPEKWMDKLMVFIGQSYVDISIDCWGGTILIMKNRKNNIGAILSFLPTAESESVAFIASLDLSGKPKRNSNILLKIKLEISRLVTIAFLKSDIPTLSGMRPYPGELLAEEDRVAKQFWEYFSRIRKTDGQL